MSVDTVSLHYSRDGFRFHADARSLTIDPGPKPITLSRAELEQLGLQVRDDFKIPLDHGAEAGTVIHRVLAALNEAVKRCSDPKHAWLVKDLRRAMVLVGGLDEKVAQQILDQEGV